MLREGSIRKLRDLPAPAERAPLGTPLPLAESVPAGRLIELSGDGRSARTTAAVSLVIRAQEAGEPVLWIQPESGTLYPPDLAASGVDLDALVVIHVPPLRGALGIVRAAELVLRSGAFGLVVGDVTAGVPRGDAWQSRLAALARQHASRVVLLSDSSVGEASLGPMVSMRIEPIRERRAPGRFVVTYRLLKDKTGGTTAPSPDLRRAPCGLP